MSVKMLTWEQAVQSLRNQPDQKELVQYCYYDDPLESGSKDVTEHPAFAKA
jgi:hypothetical protein